MPYPRSHSEVSQMGMEPMALDQLPHSSIAFDLSFLRPCGFKQWFSNFSMNKNHLEELLNM